MENPGDNIPEMLPIGEVCRLADCTARTVRFYEERGIISPAGVTAGGQKRYCKAAASVIRAVSLLREAGLSLSQAHELLDLRKSPETADRRLTLLLRRRLRAVLDALSRKRDAIDEACEAIDALLDGTQGCEKCSSTDCSGCRRLGNLRTLGIAPPPERDDV